MSLHAYVAVICFGMAVLDYHLPVESSLLDFTTGAFVAFGILSLIDYTKEK